MLYLSETDGFPRKSMVEPTPNLQIPKLIWCVLRSFNSYLKVFGAQRGDDSQVPAAGGSDSYDALVAGA